MFDIARDSLREASIIDPFYLFLLHNFLLVSSFSVTVTKVIVARPLL